MFRHKDCCRRRLFIDMYACLHEPTSRSVVSSWRRIAGIFWTVVGGRSRTLVPAAANSTAQKAQQKTIRD